MDPCGNLDVGFDQPSTFIKIKVMDSEKGYVEQKVAVPYAFLRCILSQSEHIFIGSDSLATLLAQKEIPKKNTAPWLLEHLFSLLPMHLTVDQKIEVLSRIAANVTDDSFRLLNQPSEEALDNRAHDQFDASLVSRKKKLRIAIPEVGETMRVLVSSDSIFKEEDSDRAIEVRASLLLDIATTTIHDYVKGEDPENLKPVKVWMAVAEPGRLFPPEIQVTTRLLPTAS